ncbi:hypothetical protein KUA19_30295 [Catellatospora sp. NEAU-YM18]|nr:hypothetical protein [Catellatospora tritici]
MNALTGKVPQVLALLGIVAVILASMVLGAQQGAFAATRTADRAVSVLADDDHHHCRHHGDDGDNHHCRHHDGDGDHGDNDDD